MRARNIYASGLPNEARASAPAWTGLTVSDGSGSFDDAFQAPCVVGSPCQVEDAALSGGVSRATDHSGYHGSGFTQGWGNASASARLTVAGAEPDTDYDLIVRYAAGNPGDGSTADRSLRVEVGAESTDLALPTSPNSDWDAWMQARVPLSALAGRTPITLSCTPGADCRVNVDEVAVVARGADLPTAVETATMADRGLSDYTQTLDLRTGAIVTAARWTSPAGRVSDIEYTLLTDRSEDGRAAVGVSVTPQWSGDLVITDVLDSRPATYVKQIESTRDQSAGSIGLHTEVTGSGLTSSIVSTLRGPGERSERQPSEMGLPNESVAQTLTAHVSAGDTYRFVKYVGVATTHDGADTAQLATDASQGAASAGIDAVRAANDAAWADIWRGDIRVVGDDGLQEQIRASRFYLLASVSADRAWSPSPAGLSSDGYGGHVFWDTETWMWPSLLAQDPDIAAAVLQYRSDRIDDAAANAAATIPDLMFVPYDEALGITPEYVGYNGGIIKQADVTMLTYPWAHVQDDELTARNLSYYAGKVTTTGGPSMTDAIHSIVSADLGRACDAWEYTQLSAEPFMRAPFNQFAEEREGGAFTFTTGAGCFLQEFYYGYTGLRMQQDGIAVAPILPPHLSSLTVTGMHFQGRVFDIEVGKESTRITLTEGDALTVHTSEGERTVTSAQALTIPTRTSTDCDPQAGYGELIGSLTADAGSDDGPGTFVYPSASAFPAGAFDMTAFDVYRDGDTLRFVTTVSGDITNPWGGNGMSVQLLHAYLRLPLSPEDGPVPALAGTNADIEAPWQYVLIGNGRTTGGGSGTGLYRPDGTLVSPVELSVSPRRHQIVLSLPASALGDVDPGELSYVVAMLASAERNEGPSEIRPAVDCTTPGAPDWVSQWRICGGLGTVSSETPWDTDTSEPNIIKLFAPEGTTQHEILRIDGQRSILPYVALTAAPDPGTDPGTDPTPSITISAQSVVAGGTVTVAGEGFARGERLEVTLHSDPVHLATVVADDAGTFSASTTIPATTPPGAHRVRVEGSVSGAVDVDLEVTAAAGSGSAGQPDGAGLPLTGGTIPTAILLFAAAAIAVGLILAVRRRRA